MRRTHEPRHCKKGHGNGSPLIKTAPAAKNWSKNELEPLKRKEKEILKCSMEGKEYANCRSNFLSKHTVRQHMKNIYAKLHVSSKVEALQISLKNKMDLVLQS